MGSLLPPVASTEGRSGQDGSDTARSRGVAAVSTSHSVSLKIPTQEHRSRSTTGLHTSRSKEGPSPPLTARSSYYDAMGATGPSYKTEEFTLLTSKRTRNKNRVLKLPPLPVELLNQNSTACRQVVGKLAALRSSFSERQALEDRVAAYKGRRPQPMNEEGAPELGQMEPVGEEDSLALSPRNLLAENKQEVLAMNANTRAERSQAFMDDQRQRIAEAAARRERLKAERYEKKTAGQRRHEDLKARREAAEEAARREEGFRRLLAAVHMSAVITPFLTFAKDLRRERETLKQHTLAAIILQRHSRPWVANRRARREAWASEVIGRSMRRYYLRRQLRRKKKSAAMVASFLDFMDNQSSIISTILHFKQCCGKMQRFLRSKHKEVLAQRKVDMGMWVRWEKVMLDYLHQIDAPKADGKKGKAKKEAKKEKGGGKGKKTAHGGYTFADLGGFGSVEPDLMRPLARHLKATLLQLFRRFRKAAAWHALEKYHQDMVAWEEAWEQRERIKAAEAMLLHSKDDSEPLPVETPEERQARKMKEMPPPKQLRKLLTNAEISKLHDIGLYIMGEINMSADEMDRDGFDLDDLLPEVKAKVMDDVEEIGMQTIAYSSVGDMASAMAKRVKTMRGAAMRKFSAAE
mmetsp:Transcript_47918/g.120927  ORF Transcript_47918/g.120927 Transcript_47918/m.120927 type:complete len:635 (-) Transcript_47918:76-1980(-)|eukprot:jgi/Tetstr1/455481/TSEL_042310.t1